MPDFTEPEHISDVVVIGGGIAGVSIGYELAENLSVCLLEMEDTLAVHSTGRSAATFLETYGNDQIRAITTASRRFFTDPPDLFDAPIGRPRHMLYVAGRDGAEEIRRLHEDVHGLLPAASILAPEDAERLNPLLRSGYTELGLLEPHALDLEVHEIHQGFARGLRRRNGRINRSAKLVGARFDGAAWHLSDSSGTTYRAPVVVNAAGAWCDQVAALFGRHAIGLRPLRRTVFTVPGASGDDIAGLPMTYALSDSFYFKPESGQFLCSPADETPQPAGDVRPDDLEIARALEAINAATTLGARHVRTSWAGLRTFAPDNTPIVGFDPDVTGLFWFAGQGGYGIQTSPALARIGAALLQGRSIPDDIRGLGVNPAALDPSRFTADNAPAR